MFESSLIKRQKDFDSKFKVSVPQRLDTNTSGVLIIATKSCFASYMGKLLEEKTYSHTKMLSPSKTSSITVSKRYKVLVCLKFTEDFDFLLKSAVSNAIISHLLSPERSKARLFVKMTSNDEVTDSNWLQCHLRITSVGFRDFKYVKVQGCKESSEIAGKLWGFNSNQVTSSNKFTAVTQLEVELLTGRSHQIRGQMSELGYPLVGDSLYGGDLSFAKNDKLGLHCSEISFPKPIVVDYSTTIKKKAYKKVQFNPSDKEYFTFRSDFAWWNHYVK